MTALERASKVKRLRATCPHNYPYDICAAGYLRRALDACVSGYLLKDVPAKTLATAVRRVHAGGRAIHPKLALIYAAIDNGMGLSQAARHTLLDEENSLVIGSLSLVELSNLSWRGRIPFTPKQVQLVLDSLRIDVLPYRQRHVERYAEISVRSNHKDPFDRMIIATALVERFPVVTSDKRCAEYDGPAVVWWLIAAATPQDHQSWRFNARHGR